jgi:hypothetical protein
MHQNVKDPQHGLMSNEHKLEPDPHQSEKPDPDPDQGDADPQHCTLPTYGTHSFEVAY